MTAPRPAAPGVYRTDDRRFSSLADWPHEPRYLDIPDDQLGGLRMHYVAAGPVGAGAGAGPVLLLHGQPTWSYLYRHVIAALVDAGRHVVAPDHVGFGRSDKPTDRTAYTVSRHIAWIGAFVDGLDLRDVTLVAQDWGGPIGLAVVARRPERFARLVVANTVLHTVDPELRDRLTWADHGTGPGRVEVEEALLDYMLMAVRSPALQASMFVAGATLEALSPGSAAAYDAPFPEEASMAGMRQFPALIPVTRNDPTARRNGRIWEFLGTWRKPLLTAFSDGDPATRGWAEEFRRRVPGAAGQPHVTIEGAGHFLQEDRGHELGRAIDHFIASTT